MTQAQDRSTRRLMTVGAVMITVASLGAVVGMFLSPHVLAARVVGGLGYGAVAVGLVTVVYRATRRSAPEASVYALRVMLLFSVYLIVTGVTNLLDGYADPLLIGSMTLGAITLVASATMLARHSRTPDPPNAAAAHPAC